ncbi:hypothetical protein KUTeg_011538 [Tegillarca granosa]|uniref:SET domain-containing protein n=1 Tax=Tegillarca granosa TaxID=220873 RepID=A0ABQ9F299_TEGGR|nr:hypothetical protein KUTeg_011538 [Tegillarca granosa]
MCIDASEEPNEGPLLGRLVNHGRGQEQNCTMKKVRIDNKPYLCLFAIRNIEVGEELLYNYGVDLPWETMLVYTNIEELMSCPWHLSELRGLWIFKR